MKEKIIVVSNKMGLHARPSAMIVQIASKYKSTVKIYKDDFEVDAKSIMGVMTLAATHGSELKFIADGPDENEVINAVESLFSSNFSE
ncbi:MAG: HPr family phosphocarrier protein [Endomicrobium sp.]|uniref:HPr family phosphocarrier protein n=1 Tax=Candidatus Endomicrobiellum pyrsonymphae TaxID=1408203 RepID=UPI0035805043|nr:HPr family phosphocarrier protein [Endomicrobium sp.]